MDCSPSFSAWRLAQVLLSKILDVPCWSLLVVAHWGVSDEFDSGRPCDEVRRVGDKDKDDAPMPLKPVSLDVIIMTSHGQTVRRVILVVMMWSQCCERGLEYPGLRRMVLLSCT